MYYDLNFYFLSHALISIPKLWFDPFISFASYTMEIYFGRQNIKVQ